LDGRATIVDLGTLAISPFSYDVTANCDDFHTVVQQMGAHDHLVFATPVYWYAMSSVMKTFFDRLTDLLLDKDSRAAGRALAGRDVWLLATGTDEALPLGFHEPFARTAAYFGMRWRQAFYVRSTKGAPPAETELAHASRLSMCLQA
jgi:multimeric flavodoxin WrbA